MSVSLASIHQARDNLPTAYSTLCGICARARLPIGSFLLMGHLWRLMDTALAALVKAIGRVKEYALCEVAALDVGRVAQNAF